MLSLLFFIHSNGSQQNDQNRTELADDAIGLEYQDH